MRILLIEDNPGDAMLVRIAVEEAPPGAYELEHVDRLAAGLESLGRRPADVLLLDLSLPDEQGLRTVERVREAAVDTPIVVLTGLNDEDMALRAVQVGAQDYLPKGEVTGSLLRRTIRYAIERHRLQTQMRALSTVDELSGLQNRRGFLEVAALQLRVAIRQRLSVMVLYADLDGMKEINDRLGHGSGDDAIREVAEIFRTTFRSSDVLARLGGDEFVVLAMDVNAGRPERLQERLEVEVERRNRIPGRRFPIALSVGWAFCTDCAGESLESLMSRADERMYEAKRARKRTAGAAG